ncbi:MAG: hypothetical protein LBT40_02410, partial [Deltaproteobacteria bacterium]|nr:hypothetical protein [Deltaproteobacteria bacterium]
MKETVTFLERVLPAPREDARFILCAIRQNLQKKRTRQELFQTPEALAESAFKVSGDGRDAYMALAIFDTSGYRKAAHALAARSLWLDLDSGKPGVPYATRDESLEALGAFVKKLEIPEPLLVNSGNCVHVYWPLTEELTPADWRKLAFGLKAATKALGLVVDPQRTADIASVLRVPGT